MADSVRDCEIPRDERERTKSQVKVFVNLEEKKEKLFKIASNTEPDQTNNNIELGKVLKGIEKEDLIKLCEAKDEQENTALHYAAKAGNLDICKILISYNADFNAKGQNGMKVLPFAARYGDEKRAEEVWQCMLEIAADKMKKNVPTIKSDLTPNRNLPLKQSETAVKKKEEVGPFEAYERDEYKFSLLHHAIQNTNWVKNPVVVEKLMSTKNFPITETDNQGNTCLHLAAQLDKESDDKIFDAFFDNSSINQEEISKCIEAKNNLGMTPFHIACNVGNHDSLTELLDVCRDNNIQVTKILNTFDKSGFSPLCHAIKCKNLEMVNTLLKEDAHVTKATMNISARIGDVDIMQASVAKLLFLTRKLEIRNI